MFTKSILAGLLIGLGVIINLQTSPPILGAILFSFGLLTIIHMKLPLYTGKIGYVLDDSQIRKNLPIIIIGNIIGVGAIVTLYMHGNYQFLDIIDAAAAFKFEKNIFMFLVNGIFCGILIHIAVKNKNTLITMLSVIIFILIGAEHCIADFPYFLSCPTLFNFIKILCVILGNSLGAIAIELFIPEDEIKEGDTKCATLD